MGVRCEACGLVVARRVGIVREGGRKRMVCPRCFPSAEVLTGGELQAAIEERLGVVEGEPQLAFFHAFDREEVLGG